MLAEIQFVVSLRVCLPRRFRREFKPEVLVYPWVSIVHRSRMDKKEIYLSSELYTSASLRIHSPPQEPP